MKKYSNYYLTFALLLMSYIGLFKTNIATAQAYNIKNDVFWNTKDGCPIYSQGSGIFKFPDPVTGKPTFFYTIKGSEKETVIYCGDRWTNFAGNGLGYNQ